MIKKILVILLGILLIPVCISITAALYEQLAFAGENPQTRQYFLFGIGAYLLVHLFFYVPGKLYESEHRSLDAAVKWISAGKINKLNPQATVAEDQVHPNIFLILAPHFVPVYAILFAFLYFAFSLFWQAARLVNLLLFLIGAGLVFHMTFTAQSLKARHKNLIGSAYILSTALIYIFNVVVVVYALHLLFSDISVKDFFVSSFKTTVDIYTSMFQQLFAA